MKRFWHHIKRQTWLMVLPLLLMTGYGTLAFAAQTPSFSATSSGTTNNLTLTANLNVGDADIGKNGNVYLGFNSQQAWYFNNGAGWLQYNSGALPIYAAAPLANRAIEVVRNQDLSSLVGAQLYVGYGLTENDMVSNSKYAMVYTVTATDTTAPTASGTTIANDATEVDVNTTIAASFSEAMNPASFTTTTVTLLQGTTPVLGTVSYSGGSVIFVPSAPLAANTVYTARIKGGTNGAKDLAGNALASDYVWNWTTAHAAADTTAPTISETTIADGATGVDIKATLGATFNEALNPATITNVTVTLMQGATPVLGTVSYYTGGSVVFVPSTPLSDNTVYTATIKGGVNGIKDLAGNTLASDYVWSWTTGTITARLAPVLLGTSGNFAILAKTGISTVPTSIITGDIGVSPVAATYITGFALSADATNVFSTSTQVVGGGKVYAANYAVPTPTNLTTAVLDMQTAYTDAAGRPTPDFLNLGGGTIGGLTLTPGLYTWGSSVMITTDITISGGADDVWIFQISGDLIMSAAKRITLSGGAQAKNIFWQVAGQATIGTTAHFEGNILSQTGITLQTGATMNGRALAQSLVALDSATITKPAP